MNVVEGGESVAKAEFIEGDGKDVDECLRAEGNGAPLTKTMLARKAILDKLEIAPEGLKSKALSEEIAAETGISASTGDTLSACTRTRAKDARRVWCELATFLQRAR